jgi:Holliday junction resolvase RusA-like endonuclease
MEKHPPLSGPLSVNIAFVFAKPKGKPKYKHYHDVRPDTDNLMKACLDGMAKIVFRDDAQISLLHASKRYSPDGQSWTWVRVETLEEKKP